LQQKKGDSVFLSKESFRYIKLKPDSKMPLEAWKNEQNQYSYEQIKDYDGNIGVVCGKGNLLVIDFDQMSAYEKYKDLLPDTLEVKTGKGMHLYLKYAENPEFSYKKPGWGEIRAKDCYVVAPGSIHPETKKTYNIVKSVPVQEITKKELDEFIEKSDEKEKQNNAEETKHSDDKSRSAKEYREVCRMIRKGFSKYEIFREMLAFEKWAHATPQYKELTYKNALNFVEKNPIKQKKEKGDDKPSEKKSFFVIPDEKNVVEIYEQIYDGEKHKFVKYNYTTKEIDYLDYYETDEKIIYPIMGEEIDKRVVMIPKNIKKYDNVINLDEKIRSFIKKWLDVDDNYLKYVAWNIRFSWVYDRFHTLNYTRALGDTGTGKSRFLDTIGLISYKPMMVSGALTPAPLFRIIDKWRGTLLIDEGDQNNSDEANAFIKILNCGYEKGRSVMRCDQNDASNLNFFYVYGPKVITTRKRFQDKATEARCMTKIMSQTSRNDIPDILTQNFFDEAEEIREMLLYYRLTNYKYINPEEGLKVNLNGIEPRLRQVNRGFLGMFANDPEQVEDFKNYLIEYQKEIIKERAESFDGCLVRSIAELINLFYENITPTDIATYMNENYPQQYNVNSRYLGKHAKNLGLIFVRKKIDGTTKNTLDLSDKGVINVVFSRYIVDDDIIDKLNEKGYDVTKVTSVTVSSQIQKNAKNAKNYEKSEKARAQHNERNFRNQRNPESLGKDVLHSSDYLLDDSEFFENI